MLFFFYVRGTTLHELLGTLLQCFHTVGLLKDSTNRYVSNKTTLITGGVGGAGVDPPS